MMISSTITTSAIGVMLISAKLPRPFESAIAIGASGLVLWLRHRVGASGS
jgi:hypothetical protein